MPRDDFLEALRKHSLKGGACLVRSCHIEMHVGAGGHLSLHGFHRRLQGRPGFVSLFRWLLCGDVPAARECRTSAPSTCSSGMMSSMIAPKVVACAASPPALS